MLLKVLSIKISQGLKAVSVEKSSFHIEPLLFYIEIERDLLCKGIVQRDLNGVETRLKQSVLMNYIVAKFAF